MSKLNDPVPRLFAAEPPSSEEAWKVVERIPLNATFRKEWREGKQYWFAQWSGAEGRPHVYVGNDEKKDAVVACHEVIRRELEEAAKEAEEKISPAARRLRELEARAYDRKPRDGTGAGPGVVSVPILDASFPKGRARRPRRASGK